MQTAVNTDMLLGDYVYTFFLSTPFRAPEDLGALCRDEPSPSIPLFEH